MNMEKQKKRFKNHNHIIQDIAISSDNQYALTASWDKYVKLWDLKKHKPIKIFRGHEKDVLSVNFSPDNRQIVTSSRDRKIKIWNTLGECKLDLTQDGHTDWVTCVQFSPNPIKPFIVSCGWDKVVKVWDLKTFKLRTNHLGHTGVINTVCISPDGSLCASGGKDTQVMLWDLNDAKHLYSLDAGSEIHSMCFSPTRYWLVAATALSIRIWDLEKKELVAEVSPQFDLGKKAIKPYPVSIAWAKSGNVLYAGYTDNHVRVYAVS